MNGYVYSSAVMLDTSAVIALSDPKDNYHKEALFYFENANDVTWVALNATAHETFTRARYRMGLKSALTQYDFMSMGEIKTVRFDIDDERKARTTLEKYKDKKLSFHDALCAVVMQRIKIFRIFTFDSDFWSFGFEVLPGYTR